MATKNNACIQLAQNWKQRHRNQNLNLTQNINNLQQQILNIQNNQPQLQVTGMVGYGPPIFKGNPGEDPEDILPELRRYVIGSRTPGAGQVAGRAETYGLLESCLEGP